ncbi:phospholipid carrier-dependent glycosyltransferase [Candidatus Sumerlaeota bacterium]|nr:phospholipid carrier-dependent glycosyltransferase [Candidatus Sumerlaeota bacterium]
MAETQPRSNSARRLSILQCALPPAALILVLLGRLPTPPSETDFSLWVRGLYHLRALLAVGLVPFFALVVGRRILRIRVGRVCGDPDPPLSLSLALGWGVLSLAMWFLGAVGTLTGLNPFSGWIAPVLFLVLLVYAARHADDVASAAVVRVRSAFGAANSPTGVLWALVLIVAVRYAIAALTPSFLYDVLEYHLPEVRHLLEEGSLRPIEGNSYSLMPQGVEMLFALGRLFEGGADAFAPKLVNVYLGLSTAALLVALLGRLGVSRAMRAVGALAFLAHWSAFDILRDAYADMATALYATAAVLCWVRARQEPNRLDPLLAAVFLGLALGCKYPVMGVAILPFFVVLVPLVPREALPGFLAQLNRPLRTAGVLVLLVVVFVVAYSPWLVRAWAIDRSLFPPLTVNVGYLGENSPALALRRFMAGAHRPEIFTAWHMGAFVKRLYALADPMPPVWPSRLWLALPCAAAIWILASVLAFGLHPRPDATRRGLAWFAIAGCFFWSSVPNASPRFLAPLIPLAIALGLSALPALGSFSDALRRIAQVGIFLWVVQLAGCQTMISFADGSIRAGVGTTPSRTVAARHMGPPVERFFDAVRRERVAAGPDARVLLLYEARAGAIDGPVVCSTVFDPCLLWEVLMSPDGTSPDGTSPDGTSADGSDVRGVLARLRERGIELIAVNEFELVRLLKTYPASEARQDPAFVDAVSRPGAGLYDPALWKFRLYYPPFYYSGLKGASEDATRERLKRLDRLLDVVRQRTVWESGNGALNLWVARIDPGEPASQTNSRTPEGPVRPEPSR